MIDTSQPPIEVLEQNLQGLLQRNLTFWINNGPSDTTTFQTKPIKRGKLIIYTLKDFYVQFLLDIDNKNKIYEIPYPFITFHDSDNNSVYFDYSFNTLSNNNIELLLKLKIVNRHKKNKFYDKWLQIKYT